MVFLFPLWGAKAQPKEYIDHPNRKDTLCINEVARAKKDFAAGELKFHPGAVWDYPYSRMFPTLDSLCKVQGLIFDPYTGVEHDVGIPGVTYGCYEAFMNREVEKKFGKGFRANIIRQADSIFIAKKINDTIPYHECDEPTYNCDEQFEHDFFARVKLPDKCGSDSLCNDRNNGACSFRISFVVDTSGHATAYDLFDDSKYLFSPSCMNEIKNSIAAALETLNCWHPAKLGNQKVIS
jgi:hypothetical protein